MGAKETKLEFVGAEKTPTGPYRSAAARASVLESYDQIVLRWPVSYESRYIDTSLGKGHVLISGVPSAKPVVLLHGGGGNATMWVHNVAILATALRVYAVDIAGDVGKSEGRRPSTEREYVSWLSEMLDGLGLERVGLCGASFGAWLASAYARHFPRRISEIALLAPPNLGPLRSAFIFRAALATVLPGEGRVRKFYRYISSPQAPVPPEWALRDFVIRWQCQRHSPPPPPLMTEEELRQLPKDTLMLLGNDEVLYGVSNVLPRIRACAPHIVVEFLARAGHTISVDRADEVSARLLKFFGSSRPDIAVEP